MFKKDPRFYMSYSQFPYTKLLLYSETVPTETLLILRPIILLILLPIYTVFVFCERSTVRRLYTPTVYNRDKASNFLLYQIRESP